METGYFLLLRGDVDQMDIEEPTPPPLVHYRSRYLGIRDRRTPG